MDAPTANTPQKFPPDVDPTEQRRNTALMFDEPPTEATAEKKLPTKAPVVFSIEQSTNSQPVLLVQSEGNVAS